MEIDTVGYNLTREDMVKLWSTKESLGREYRELLVWHHRLNR